MKNLGKFLLCFVFISFLTESNANAILVSVACPAKIHCDKGACNFPKGWASALVPKYTQNADGDYNFDSIFIPDFTQDYSPKGSLGFTCNYSPYDYKTETILRLELDPNASLNSAQMLDSMTYPKNWDKWTSPNSIQWKCNKADVDSCRVNINI